MVGKILDTFPMAIEDEDYDKKNIVLLAEKENRNGKCIPATNNQGNSALHLAAKFEDFRPSSLIPGAALQMQWETKWYKQFSPLDTKKKIFAMDLPRKLLIGLTSLFISVVSILISFCSGRSLVVRDELTSAAYPIYAATCLPTTLFALAQIPLYFDLTMAIFRKVPKRSYKVF
ncbi:Ankyrin repeat-containing protein [Melia azedarach]|uniref:Ankyrin repeat-containing protein n=1 Tax=Melia azedarach TaxID=155640 RepID=A0ACC1YGR3_MELAZ|nr:Ankyrin repeat-containing protein [Melia azedarach]